MATESLKAEAREKWVTLCKQIGNVSVAARRCGIARSTLQRWIKREGENLFTDRSHRPHREIIIIEPTEDVTGCTIIGEEVTEVLDLIPAEFFVKDYIRYKYVRANGEGIITASLPERVIDKGIPSEAVIAQMVVDKYVFGLPLHCQIDKYRRLGVNVPASTASDWIMKGWQQLAPLWELLKLLVLNQKYLQRHHRF